MNSIKSFKKFSIELFIVFFLLLNLFLITTFSKGNSSEIQLKDEKVGYPEYQIILPSHIQPGKVQIAIILDKGINDILLNGNKIDVFEQQAYNFLILSVPLGYKKEKIDIEINFNGKKRSFSVPVVNYEPYESSVIILEPEKAQIRSDSNKEKIDAENKLISKILSEKTPYRIFTLPFNYPLKNIAISSNFGKKRDYKDSKGNYLYSSTHLGVDLKGAKGTEVYASSCGKVVYAANSLTRGNCVYIDHGLGLYTSYFHMDSINVKQDQIVNENELIGKVGSTGLSTGPHLHFGVIFNIFSMDPLSFIKEINSIDEVYQDYVIQVASSGK
jgi:murein DD-endopeptidase MepM/ murein hydrolase activator NlpD